MRLPKFSMNVASRQGSDPFQAPGRNESGPAAETANGLSPSGECGCGGRRHCLGPCVLGSCLGTCIPNV
ncbi:hypothetical protein Pan44_21410 [Caulifigura coniformis]|uniref:Uncharacterized protein n=1 Tax=Caulifigura coniformis TaxID=2527983 RepID=A0A517SDA7_9PLAN|nr:hypothetical protein Pan44_21410 [Caulifigura coniformis]